MGTKLDFKVKKGLDVEGGDITVATGNSVYADTFDTNVAAAGVTLSGTTLAADGSNTNINIAITPKGSGEVDISKVDIDGGSIDGTTIATSNITVGSGYTLDVSGGTLTLADDQISGDKISGGTIGTTTITELAGDLSLGDNNITNVGDINADSISVDTAAAGLNVDFSGANTGTALITLKDNLASALDITEGNNSYLKFVTTDSSEAIELGKNTSIAGTAAITGSAANQNVAVIKTTSGASTSGNAFDIQWHNGTAYASAFTVSAVTGATSITGSAANKDVTVIKTTNAASTSGNALDVQWHNGSDYASALKISAQYGRMGIGTTPDTSTGASAYKVKIGGNANVAGTVNATGNLTVTGTGSTGGDFTAIGNNKPVKLKMSNGFPTGSGTGSHPITDYDDNNFYSSMVKETTLPNASGTLTGSTVRSVGYINVDSGKDVFQVVEIFATISIKAAGENGALKKRLKKKFMAFYHTNHLIKLKQ